MKTDAVIFTLLIASAGASCGQGVVPGAAYDRPLLSFSGTISPAGGLGQAQHPIVGLLWTDPLQRGADVTMPARWLQSTVVAAGDTFTVDIFRPPPPAAMVDLADPSGKFSQRLAMADRYLAGSANVLTYVERPFSSPQINSPLTLPAQIGYSLVNYLCQGQLSAAIHPVNPEAVEMILQPSQDFPDVRTCRATHGP